MKSYLKEEAYNYQGILAYPNLDAYMQPVIIFFQLLFTSSTKVDFNTLVLVSILVDIFCDLYLIILYYTQLIVS